MFFQTQLDDQTWILLDAEATTSFEKSHFGHEATPANAVQNTFKLAAQFTRALSQQMEPVVHAGHVGMGVELSFAIKVDVHGNVFISHSPEDGQFRLTVRWQGK